jgi:tryptophanyl-tRNA synthetase
MTAKAGEKQEEARAVKLAEKQEKIAEKIAERVASKEEETAERQQQKEADVEGGSILEELSKIAKKLRGNSSKEYYSASYPSVKRSK